MTNNLQLLVNLVAELPHEGDSTGGRTNASNGGTNAGSRSSNAAPLNGGTGRDNTLVMLRGLDATMLQMALEAMAANGNGAANEAGQRQQAIVSPPSMMPGAEMGVLNPHQTQQFMARLALPMATTPPRTNT